MKLRHFWKLFVDSTKKQGPLAWLSLIVSILVLTKTLIS